MLLAGGGVDAGELFLFRGEFIYIIPPALGEAMARAAGREQWRHFDEHTRVLDADADGEEDRVAVAFGARTGHGAQVRYRLLRTDDGTRRLGRWIWGVVTAPDGAVLLERFNP